MVPLVSSTRKSYIVQLKKSIYSLDLPGFRPFISYFLFLNLLDTSLLFPFQRRAVCFSGLCQFPYCHSDTFGKLYSIKLKGSYHSLKKLTINADLKCCSILGCRQRTWSSLAV